MIRCLFWNASWETFQPLLSPQPQFYFWVSHLQAKREGGREGQKDERRERVGGEGWGKEGKRKRRRGRLRFKTNTPKGQMQPVSQGKESPPHGVSTWKFSEDQRDGPLCHWSHSMSAVPIPPLLTSKRRLIHLNTLLCVHLVQEVICFKCSCMGMWIQISWWWGQTPGCSGA